MPQDALIATPHASKPAYLPLVVMLLGLCLAAAAAMLLQRDVDTNGQALLQHDVTHLSLEVQQRFQQVARGLRGLSGLYAAETQVSRAQFKAYVASRDLPVEYPGALGFGFIERLPRAQIAAFEAREQADGAPGFKVHALQDTSHADLYVIKLIEPAAPNQPAMGLDVGSEPQRRAAVEQAIDSGQPTLTGMIDLAQASGRGPGFLLYLPVYRPGQPTDTPAQRRLALRGLLYAPLRTTDVLSGLFDASNPKNYSDLELALFDAHAATPADRLAFDSRQLRQASSASAPDHAHRFEVTVALPLNGRAMTLRFRSTPTFEAYVANASPWLVMAAGTLASALMALLLWHQTSSRRRTEDKAQRLTVDLNRLALVARETPNAVVMTDAARLITWVNPAFERMSGYSMADVMGRSPGALLQCDETDPITVKRMSVALKAGKSFNCDIVNRHKSGRVYWTDLQIQPILDAAGVLTGFMAMQSDITERKLAEAALRDSQAFLDKAGRIGGVGGWEFDLATQTLKWSDQTSRILDVDLGIQPSLDECKAFAPPETLATLQHLIDQGLEGSIGCDIELPLVTAKGRDIWVRFVAEGEYSDGGPVRIVGALQDITARQAMKAEVQRSAQLLRGAIDTIDEAFVLYDPDDRLVFCNEKYRQVYNTSSELMVPGTPFEDILRHGAERGQYPEAIGRVDEWVAERLAQHRASDTTLIQPVDNGRVLRILERKMPDGHTVSFRIDITDLTRAKEAAEHANHAKSDFIATISHELRTPLQSIMGFSELGKHFAAAQPQFQQMFTDIHDGGQRMLKLVNGLLDVSKFDSQAAPLQTKPRDLAMLTVEVVRELQQLAQERQLSIKLPEPLPQLAVNVEGFRIQQVVRNVLANAIRFSPPGQCIEITARTAEGSVELSVRDHGLGIPEDELEAVFEPFVQSSRTRDGSGGTGLGLAICRKIMRAHGGGITAHPAEGGGTVLCMRLPALESGQEAALAPPSNPATEAAPDASVDGLTASERAPATCAASST
jgi:PAS domain S-box-containing protein